MGHQWIATVGSARDEIEVELVHRGGDSLVLRIDGEEHEVDAKRIGGGTWSLIVGHRSVVVELISGQGCVALSESAELDILLEDARRKRLAEAVGQGPAASGEILRAPIAGRVVKVLVAPGEEVAAGQSVVVLEAMKMENEIKASRPGSVESIHVADGQPVESSQLLVTLV